ncbi:cytochrome P450 2H2-like isoform X2 [Tetranychus urticae]|uniref:cytochrome P450 2H2-like isoform X2 n=1 Tax=Tetranychus urticae TaxID=32264 RepID=UPI000D65868E|nr:cytochrome P450 2H2-like isoform X2 [Tetranychus urticae]
MMPLQEFPKTPIQLSFLYLMNILCFCLNAASQLMSFIPNCFNSRILVLFRVMFSLPVFSLLVNTLIGVALFWLVKYLFYTIKRIYQLPAGPWGLPIVGYLPFLGDHVYLQFDQLSKKYGPVYCLKLGKHNVVLVCDWPHLKDAISNDALLARPHEALVTGVYDTRSFVEMSGDPWRQHKRLSLHILRDVGLGKSKIETLIKEEIDQFLTTLDNNSEPLDFSRRIGPSISNNVAILLFGHKYDYNDPVKIEMDRAQNVFTRLFKFAGILAFLPWLSKLLIFLEEIDRHRGKHNNTHEVVDYIDGYLEERRNRERQNISEGSFSEMVLRRNVAAFFGAGSETVYSTMEWTMLYLVKYPEYQDKIRSEIADVIGFERRPDYADRARMPFTMAFIHEVQRIESIIANNLLRRASEDTKIGHYSIPKDTLVIFNFWSINRDPKLWPNPDKFDPTRYLTEDGTKAVKPPYLIPFSAGKRNCPGEGLANLELFLYLVCMVQRYRIKVEPRTELSFEAVFGISRRPANLPAFIFEKIVH